MMLIDTRAVIHATIAANKDWYKLILISELLIKSKLVKTKDAKIMGIDKSIEKIAADDLSNPKKRAPVIVTPALLAPGIKAFIPGASRAGVTITGARFLGFDRSSAAIFSMLLSIPIILASLVLTSLDFISSSEININLYQSLFAAIVACITALVSINIMMRIIQSSTFNIFIIYRVLLGFILLYFYA